MQEKNNKKHKIQIHSSFFRMNVQLGEVDVFFVLLFVVHRLGLSVFCIRFCLFGYESDDGRIVLP